MGASAGRRIVTDDLEGVDDSACHILHVDMDAFFAFVELRQRPELRGRPMMVAGTSGRSVVLSATYEARAEGVRSGMPIGKAKALCPQIVIIPPEHGAYSAVSAEVMAIFADVTPLVEPLSVDEAFLDVSGAGRIGGRPTAIAANIRRRIADQLDLTATVGVAASKFMAKLASGLAKPDGLLVVPPADQLGLLHPLPVRALWGVGPAAEKTLLALGLTTVGDVAGCDRAWLIRRLGSATGSKLHDLSWARDERTVISNVAEESIGAEVTFAVDTFDRDLLRRELLALSERIARRARTAGLHGRTVAIKVRYSDFTTVSRSVTLPAPTNMLRGIHAAAVGLLDRLGDDGRVRLIGVRLEGLTDITDANAHTQGELPFDIDDGIDNPEAGEGRWRGVENTVDEVSARFGDAAIRPASLLNRSTGRPRSSTAESERRQIEFTDNDSVVENHDSP